LSFFFSSKLGFLDGNSDLGGEARSVLVVDLVDMGEESFLDVTAAL